MPKQFRSIALALVFVLIGCGHGYRNAEPSYDDLNLSMKTDTEGNLSKANALRLSEDESLEGILPPQGMVIIMFYENKNEYIGHSALVVLLHNAYPKAKIFAQKIYDGGELNQFNKKIMTRYKLDNLPATLIYPDRGLRKKFSISVVQRIEDVNYLKTAFNTVVSVVNGLYSN